MAIGAACLDHAEVIMSTSIRLEISTGTRAELHPWAQVFRV